MRHLSQIRDLVLGCTRTLSVFARHRTSRRRMFALAPRPEQLEDRSCPSSYSLTLLSQLPGDESASAYSINDAGQAVGQSQSSDGSTQSAVLWQSGESTPIDLGTLGGSSGTAYGINGVGQVVGGSATASGVPHPFLWQNGAMIDLGTLGGSGGNAYGINASGQVVGSSYTTTGADHAFLWQNGVAMTDLGTLGGNYSRAYGINLTGQVVGESNTASGAKHAFLWQNGTMTDLGVPKNGTGSSWVKAINSSGQVAGAATFKTRPFTRAVLGQNGGWTDLGTLNPRVSDSYSHSIAHALNDSGLVVGRSSFQADGGSEHAFVWNSKVGMQDLNTLIPSGSGLTLSWANGINNNGRIVGSANGCGFLLTPTTAPVSKFTAASPGGAVTAAASPPTPLGMTSAGSDHFGSFPQGPLGVIPEIATRAMAPLLKAHRRQALGVADLSLGSTEEGTPLNGTRL